MFEKLGSAEYRWLDSDQVCCGSQIHEGRVDGGVQFQNGKFENEGSTTTNPRACFWGRVASQTEILPAAGAMWISRDWCGL